MPNGSLVPPVLVNIKEANKTLYQKKVTKNSILCLLGMGTIMILFFEDVLPTDSSPFELYCRLSGRLEATGNCTDSYKDQKIFARAICGKANIFLKMFSFMN